MAVKGRLTGRLHPEGPQRQRRTATAELVAPRGMRRSRRGRRSAKPLQLKAGPAPDQPPMRGLHAGFAPLPADRHTPIAPHLHHRRHKRRGKTRHNDHHDYHADHNSGRAQHAVPHTASSIRAGNCIPRGIVSQPSICSLRRPSGVNKQLEGKQDDKTQAQTS